MIAGQFLRHAYGMPPPFAQRRLLSRLGPLVQRGLPR